MTVSEESYVDAALRRKEGLAGGVAEGRRLACEGARRRASCSDGRAAARPDAEIPARACPIAVRRVRTVGAEAAPAVGQIASEGPTRCDGVRV